MFTPEFATIIMMHYDYGLYGPGLRKEKTRIR